MATSWKNFRQTLSLTPEEEEIVNLEKSVITAIVDAREENGLTQKQLSELCGVQQPVIARIERAIHSPQINSIIRILKPLGYTLAVVKEEAAER
ncbi:MAG: helix-turn-helix domain-containing protein [Defluviitaleaceae bacterium]|nr:helix-turn-helix domain-containing protein [Defluviitaleaceae bacterium]MCL2240665.1 helix-turn-helix domain-containing protein [Defluviitaleaceae bacterium]